MIDMNQTTIKRIPYGISDYRRIQDSDSYYVDKTHHIPLVETAPFYLFCLRPRRSGKSLWLSVLQHYYDINLADEFEFLFGDTYIGQHPTSERNSYLVMMFNFSLVSSAMGEVRESFEDIGGLAVQDFLKRYERFFDDDERNDILNASNIEQKLGRIFLYATQKKLKTYLLIDEYDNFTNTVLANEGQRAYHDMTHGSGFLRHFFNLLKGATGGQISGLNRLFITGVSPVTMDDVTSGFNIGTNISLESEFNELIGFTNDEVEAMLQYYHERGWSQLPIEDAISLMKSWYDNYYFSDETETPMFNSDMALYFLRAIRNRSTVPLRLIDQNVRIDYGKLRHLMLIDSHIKSEKPKLNGNYTLLQDIIQDGEVISPINASFPLEELLNRENFISLLYYFGLLSFTGEFTHDLPLLRIPNRTIKYLMYGYMRSSLEAAEILRVDIRLLNELLSKMSHQGEWRAFFDYLNHAVEEQAAMRDHLNAEKVFHGFLLAYLNVTHHFHTWSERELGGGFVDLYLEPFIARFPNIKYGYLIELKYMSQSEYDKKCGKEKFQKLITDAEEQLDQYANDTRLAEVAQQVTIKRLVLAYRGWELVHAEEVGDDKMTR